MKNWAYSDVYLPMSQEEITRDNAIFAMKILSQRYSCNKLHAAPCYKKYFSDSLLEKIRGLHKIIQKKRVSALIETDGGINETTIREISAAGVNIFVAGSSIFGSRDYHTTINNFRTKISA